MRSEKEKISRKRWDEINIDKVRLAKRKWYYKHRERILSYRKEYNPIRNIVLRDRRRKNPLKVHVDNHNRRLLTKDLTVSVIQRVYEDNIKLYGTLTCYLCEKQIPFGKDNLEHKTPISRGGTNYYENLGVSCQACNCSKHNKTDKEFIQWREAKC